MSKKSFNVIVLQTDGTSKQEKIKTCNISIKSNESIINHLHNYLSISTEKEFEIIGTCNYNKDYDCHFFRLKTSSRIKNKHLIHLLNIEKYKSTSKKNNKNLNYITNNIWVIKSLKKSKSIEHIFVRHWDSFYNKCTKNKCSDEKYTNTNKDNSNNVKGNSKIKNTKNNKILNKRENTNEYENKEDLNTNKILTKDEDEDEIKLEDNTDDEDDGYEVNENEEDNEDDDELENGNESENESENDDDDDKNEVKEEDLENEDYDNEQLDDEDDENNNYQEDNNQYDDLRNAELYSDNNNKKNNRKIIKKSFSKGNNDLIKKEEDLNIEIEKGPAVHLLKQEINLSNVKSLVEIRKKCLKIIQSLFNKSEKNLGRSIEKGIYNYSIQRCIDKEMYPSWDNLIFKEIYLGKCKSIYTNLNSKSYVKNTDLIHKVKLKEIQPDNLANLKPIEIFPEIWEHIIKENEHREKVITESMMGSATDKFVCPNKKCRARKAVYTEVQTRSADEPMTLFISCLVCGHRWRM